MAYVNSCRDAWENALASDGTRCAALLDGAKQRAAAARFAALASSVFEALLLLLMAAAVVTATACFIVGHPCLAVVLVTLLLPGWWFNPYI